MKKVLGQLTTIIILFFQIGQAYAVDAPQEINSIVGAYNHLTISLSLMRHGLAASIIRQDILSNLEMNSLPEYLLKDYKALLNLSDKISQKKDEIAAKQEIKKKQNEDKKSQEEIIGFLNTVIAAESGGLLPIAMSIFGMIPQNQNEVQETDTDAKQIDSIYRQEISEIEFDLALRRGQLLEKYKFNVNLFVSPENIDEYLKLKNANLPQTDYIRKLSVLHRNCPALYPVSFELGYWNMNNKENELAKNNLKSVLQFTPTVLRKVPLRSYSHAFLGKLEALSGNCDTAFVSFSEALQELPGNEIALNSRATCYHIQKQYAKAIDDYASYFTVSGDDPIINYNYACALAMAGKHFDQVIQQLRRAMRAGFTNIKHAQSDAELTSVQGLQEFKNLFLLKNQYSCNWNMMSPDQILITNISENTYTNIKSAVAFRMLNPNGQIAPTWYHYGNNKFLTKERIKPGETVNLNAFDTTKQSLAQVLVDIVCDQGHVQTTFGNDGGKLKVIDHKVMTN